MVLDVRSIYMDVLVHVRGVGVSGLRLPAKVVVGIGPFESTGPNQSWSTVSLDVFSARRGARNALAELWC